MFAKVMSIPDELLREWFELLTDRPAAQIAELITKPMDAKKQLGKDIAGFYYGEEAAAEAAAEWGRRFSQRQDPTDIPEGSVPRSELTDGQIGIVKLLSLLGLAKSNNEARRLVQQGGVNTGPDREKIIDPMAKVTLTDGLIVRAGKLHIVRIRLQ